MQRELANILNGVFQPRVHVHGFVIGRSPYTNAQQHERQRWVMKLDLDDFFPTINFGRVRGMFMAHPFDYNPEVATTLAQICCHQGHLPQGAPTSPIISNFICRGLDADLARLARAEKCRYTRYADDLCFSTNRVEFPSPLATRGPTNELQIGAPLLDAITKHGFKPSAEKTRLLRRAQRQRVTGLVVNRKTNVPASYVRALRNLLFIWGRYGDSEAAAAFERFELPRNRPPAKGAADFKQVVRGRVQYVGSIKGWSNETYKALASKLQEVDPTFRPKTLLLLTEPQRVRLYTEGASDPLHLLAAHRAFVSQGKFIQLEFEVPDDGSAGGDNQLLAKFEELSLEDQPSICICMFDRDNQDVQRKAVGSTRFRVRSKDVAAVVLEPPEWRDPRVCIEMLYRDEDLRRRDLSNRRLYLAQEFDQEQASTRPRASTSRTLTGTSLTDLSYARRSSVSERASPSAYPRWLSPTTSPRVPRGSSTSTSRASAKRCRTSRTPSSA
jgi:RNA-directed DNA polymerase